MVAMACETRRCRVSDASGSRRHVARRRPRGCRRLPGDGPRWHDVVGRYYDPQTGQFLSVDPDLQQTQEPYEYTSDDPVNANDPAGQSVNLPGTAAWAKNNLNSAVAYYSSDCTDFVSQALYYGGNDPQNTGPNAVQDISNSRYWFFYHFSRETIASLSWRVAPDLAMHFVLNGSDWLVKGGATPERSTGKWAQVQPGDIIFANWSGNTFGGISHCGVVVEKLSGAPYLRIAQHTPDQITTLAYWLNDGGSDVHVWIVAPAPR
jgi:hypothetical protein